MDWSKIEKDLQMQTEYLSAGRRDRGDRSSISNSLLSSSQAPSLGAATNRTSLYGAANTTGTRRNLYAIDDPKVNMSISSQGNLLSHVNLKLGSYHLCYKFDQVAWLLISKAAK